MRMARLSAGASSTGVGERHPHVAVTGVILDPQAKSVAVDAEWANASGAHVRGGSLRTSRSTSRGGLRRDAAAMRSPFPRRDRGGWRSAVRPRRRVLPPVESATTAEARLKRRRTEVWPMSRSPGGGDVRMRRRRRERVPRSRARRVTSREATRGSARAHADAVVRDR